MDRLKKEAALVSRFSLVGALNTCLGFSLIFFLMFLELSPYLSNIISYSIGILISFFLNKHFVFKSKNKHMGELIKFVAAAAIAYLLNIWMLHFSLSMDINPYLCQTLAAGIYTASHFILSRIWTFKT